MKNNLAIALVTFACCLAASPGTSLAGGSANYLFPDLVPYVEEDAVGRLETLQNWQLSGNQIQFDTLFSNQGDGVFEIRPGASIDDDRYELLQRVYIEDDYPATNFQDFNIGDAPKPNSSGVPPIGNPANVIWFENFSQFSLYEAPVVDGVLTVGDELASNTKTSWRLSPNTGPLPGFEGLPANGSANQAEQQRIGVGWADLYSSGSMGQFVDITGVVAGPLYWLRQTVDPMNRITETDETNNSYELLIDLSQPGQAFRYGGEYGSFLQPGDTPPIVQGDLTGDSLVTSADWDAFKAASETDLFGLSDADAYALGDLNLDGRHSLADAALFRQYYDQVNGAGAFAAMHTVPEPSTVILAGVSLLVVGYIGRRQLYRARRGLVVGLTIATLLVASSPQQVLADVTLWTEDFESVTLGPNVDEGLADATAWTDTPPADWTVDDSGVPTVGDPANGVTEWEGWSFADKIWWLQTAGNQGRAEFTRGQGVVAVADPDEWDDRGTPSAFGLYNAFMSSPAIDVSGVAAGALRLDFASSWRAEDTQTATLAVRYDGGPPQEVLRWESANPGSNPLYKSDATNELVQLALDNPAASTVQFEFGMVDAANDWWWAVDNLALVEATPPPKLQVDTTTGEMTILNAYDVTGYEVLGPPGSLDEAAWMQTNLDAHNVGSTVTADFNNDHVVNLADYTLWRNHLGSQIGPDADGDGTTGTEDYLEWKQQFGDQLAAGESWEVVASSDERLSEFLLSGAASDAVLPIGQGYNAVADLRELRFYYSTSTDLEVLGTVVYTNTPAAMATAVPEPNAWRLLATLAAVATCVGCGRLRTSRFGQESPV